MRLEVEPVPNARVNCSTLTWHLRGSGNTRKLHGWGWTVALSLAYVNSIPVVVLSQTLHMSHIHAIGTRWESAVLPLSKRLGHVSSNGVGS